MRIDVAPSFFIFLTPKAFSTYMNALLCYFIEFRVVDFFDFEKWLKYGKIFLSKSFNRKKIIISGGFQKALIILVLN